MLSLKDHGATFDNRLLAALPREEYERLSPHLELVRLALGKTLYKVVREVTEGKEKRVGV